MSIEEIPPSPTVEGAEANVSSTEITVPDAPKLCGVCNEKIPKYKCTRCQLPYCSVACSTQHKATHPAIDTTPAATPNSIPKSNADADQPKARAGTVGFRDPFAALEDSDKLRELFKQYPRLPTQLEEIHTATLQPLDEMDGEAQFKSRGGGRGGKERWNRDKGIQNGLAALSVARSTHGTDGEAVREFCKLVLQILSGEQEVAVELVEKERTEEDRKIIQELLSRELR